MPRGPRWSSSRPVRAASRPGPCAGAARHRRSRRRAVRGRTRRGRASRCGSGCRRARGCGTGCRPWARRRRAGTAWPCRGTPRSAPCCRASGCGTCRRRRIPCAASSIDGASVRARERVPNRLSAESQVASVPGTPTATPDETSSGVNGVGLAGRRVDERVVRDAGRRGLAAVDRADLVRSARRSRRSSRHRRCRRCRARTRRAPTPWRPPRRPRCRPCGAPRARSGWHWRRRTTRRRRSRTTSTALPLAELGRLARPRAGCRRPARRRGRRRGGDGRA